MTIQTTDFKPIFRCTHNANDHTASFLQPIGAAGLHRWEQLPRIEIPDSILQSMDIAIDNLDESDNDDSTLSSMAPSLDPDNVVVTSLSSLLENEGMNVLVLFDELQKSYREGAMGDDGSLRIATVPRSRLDLRHITTEESERISSSSHPQRNVLVSFETEQEDHDCGFLPTENDSLKLPHTSRLSRYHRRRSTTMGVGALSRRGPSDLDAAKTADWT